MRQSVKAANFLGAVVLIVCSIGQTWVAAQDLEVATALSMTEGPTVDREGNVYFTDDHNPADHAVQQRRRPLDLSGAQQRSKWIAHRRAGPPYCMRGFDVCDGAAVRAKGERQATRHADRPEDRKDGDPCGEVRREALDRPKRRHHRRQRASCISRTSTVLQCIESMRPGKLSRILARSGYSKAQWHPDFTGRQDPLPRRSERRRRRRKNDSRLRSGCPTGQSETCACTTTFIPAEAPTA